MIIAVKPNATRLNIHPGDWHFGRDYQNIYTVLGSCVAVTVWHPRFQIGGMCHFVLPGAPNNPTRKGELATRYAKPALLLLKRAMQTHAQLNEYQIGVYGGSDMLINFGIGKQNIFYAEQWLADENVKPVVVDVGGNQSRAIILNILTGVIVVKKV